MLQAALNGRRTRDEHPLVPITAQELARDAAACAAAGAAAMHIHPRGEDGFETLEPRVVDAVVRVVRDVAGVPVGVSTGAWMEPDPDRRAALVARWRAPDYASVNVSEEGWEDVMGALDAAGIGIEAGVWSVEDAEALGAARIPVMRVLVETRSLAVADAIHGALDRLTVIAPRLQHGEDEEAWALLDDAVRRRCDSRIGMEDTVQDTNEALVRAALARR